MILLEIEINLGCEFCYKHMAIVVGKEVKADEILVIPLTSYKQGDELYPTNIIIDTNLYGYMVQNKTTIKINHLRSIDKKKSQCIVLVQYMKFNL